MILNDSEGSAMRLDASWKDDCQGKKDYDGPIVEISSRYYPRGGGFTSGRRVPGGIVDWEENEDRPEIKPSAVSSLLLRYSENDYIELAKEEFEGETQEIVQKQVEEWAQKQFDEVVEILKSHYQFSEKPK